jgi:hypothetical protein
MQLREREKAPSEILQRPYLLFCVNLKEKIPERKAEFTVVAARQKLLFQQKFPQINNFDFDGPRRRTRSCRRLDRRPLRVSRGASLGGKSGSFEFTVGRPIGIESYITKEPFHGEARRKSIF